MKNAHERLGQVSFTKHTQTSSTNVSCHCDRYASTADGELDILSFFGNDAEVAAIHAAVFKSDRLGIRFPQEKEHFFTFEKDPVCYRSAIQMPGMKTKLRHLVAISQKIIQNGTLGAVYCLANEPHMVWNTLVHSLGLPASPEWAEWIYDHLMADEKITPLVSHGLSMIAVETTREEMLRLIKHGVEGWHLPFPETNCLNNFPRVPMRDAIKGLTSISVTPELAAYA